MSEWLTRADAAARYNIPVGTLENWATTGKGPRYTRAGRRVLYRADDFEAWLEAHLVEPEGRGSMPRPLRAVARGGGP